MEIIRPSQICQYTHMTIYITFQVSEEDNNNAFVINATLKRYGVSKDEESRGTYEFHQQML